MNWKERKTLKKELNRVIDINQEEIHDHIDKCNSKYITIPICISSYYPYVNVTFNTKTKKYKIVYG